jgi:hypothetical protein
LLCVKGTGLGRFFYGSQTLKILRFFVMRIERVVPGDSRPRARSRLRDPRNEGMRRAKAISGMTLTLIASKTNRHPCAEAAPGKMFPRTPRFPHFSQRIQAARGNFNHHLLLSKHTFVLNLLEIDFCI